MLHNLKWALHSAIYPQNIAYTIGKMQCSLKFSFAKCLYECSAAKESFSRPDILSRVKKKKKKINTGAVNFIIDIVIIDKVINIMNGNIRQKKYFQKLKDKGKQVW